MILYITLILILILLGWAICNLNNMLIFLGFSIIIHAAATVVAVHVTLLQPSSCTLYSRVFSDCEKAG